VVAGCLLGTFFMAFHSTQGPQLGLPQMIQSRPQFGYRGALLVWAAALVAYIGFNAFNQVLAAQALHQLSASISATSPAAIVLFALSAVGLAAVGYDKIHLAQRAFAYLMIAILTVFTLGGLLLLRFPAAQWDPAGFRSVPFLAQLFAAASYQLSWSIYVSDYSRYLPRDVGVRASFWWTYLGAFVGGSWTILVGSVVASNAIALGSSSNFVNRFGDLLSLLLYLFTPWTAINLVDFYLVRRGHYSIREIFNPSGMYGRWNWRGLIAYVVGFVVMIPFFSSGLYTGPVARALGGADIAMLVGL